MLNGFYDAVKAVAPTDVVVAGGTAPFFDNAPEVDGDRPRLGPAQLHAQPPLPLGHAAADVQHARRSSTSGRSIRTPRAAPSHRASLPNDVSLPDLPKMHAVLAGGASRRPHRVVGAAVRALGARVQLGLEPARRRPRCRSVLHALGAAGALQHVAERRLAGGVVHDARHPRLVCPSTGLAFVDGTPKAARAGVRIPPRRDQPSQPARGLGQDAGRPTGGRDDRALDRRRPGRPSGRCRATRTASSRAGSAGRSDRRRSARCAVARRAVGRVPARSRPERERPRPGCAESMSSSPSRPGAGPRSPRRRPAARADVSRSSNVYKQERRRDDDQTEAADSTARGTPPSASSGSPARPGSVGLLAGPLRRGRGRQGRERRRAQRRRRRRSPRARPSSRRAGVIRTTARSSSTHPTPTTA